MTRRLIILLSAFLLIGFYLQSSATWARSFGERDEDFASSIALTSDGGYIVAGWSRSFGGENVDFWVIKLDGNGNIQWEKSYGAKGREKANCVIQTKDGGYIVAGNTTSFQFHSINVWVLKLDKNGNIEWQKTYGELGNETAESIIQTSDGGYLILGLIQRIKKYVKKKADFFLLKLDSQGNVEWNKAYGGYGYDEGYSVIQTSDGGYAVTGMSESFTKRWSNFWVIKLDSKGNSQWQKTYGGKMAEWPYEIVQTDDGGYAVAGLTHSFGSRKRDVNVWLIRLNKKGDILWQKSYGNTDVNHMYGMIQTSDKGFVLAGLSDVRRPAFEDAWVFKVDSRGNLQWSKTYGGAFHETARSIKQTQDGGFVVAGASSSFFPVKANHFLVFKTAPNGNISNCPELAVLNLNIEVFDTNAVAKETHIKPDIIKIEVIKTNVRPVSTRAKKRIICR